MCWTRDHQSWVWSISIIKKWSHLLQSCKSSWKLFLVKLLTKRKRRWICWGTRRRNETSNWKLSRWLPCRHTEWRRKLKSILSAYSAKILKKDSHIYWVTSSITISIPKRYCKWMFPLCSSLLVVILLMKNVWEKCIKESSVYGILASSANLSPTFFFLGPLLSFPMIVDSRKYWSFWRILLQPILSSSKSRKNSLNSDRMMFQVFIACWSRLWFTRSPYTP